MNLKKALTLAFVIGALTLGSSGLYAAELVEKWEGTSTGYIELSDCVICIFQHWIMGAQEDGTINDPGSKWWDDEGHWGYIIGYKGMDEGPAWGEGTLTIENPDVPITGTWDGQFNNFDGLGWACGGTWSVARIDGEYEGEKTWELPEP